VAVFLKEESLKAKLDTLGFVCASSDMGALASLVVNRNGLTFFDLDEVDLADDTELFGGEGDGAGVDTLTVFRPGKLSRRRVHAAVTMTAFDSVGRFIPLALDPFEVR
jgi:hypothetical protein